MDWQASSPKGDPGPPACGRELLIPSHSPLGPCHLWTRLGTRDARCKLAISAGTISCRIQGRGILARQRDKGVVRVVEFTYSFHFKNAHDARVGAITRGPRRHRHLRAAQALSDCGYVQPALIPVHLSSPVPASPLTHEAACPQYPIRHSMSSLQTLSSSLPPVLYQNTLPISAQKVVDGFS